MGSPVVHWELMSKDPAKVAEFYEKIFGWKVQHIPDLNYRTVDTGGEEGTRSATQVPDCGTNGATVTFTINGSTATPTAIFTSAGQIKVTISATPCAAIVARC